MSLLKKSSFIFAILNSITLKSVVQDHSVLPSYSPDMTRTTNSNFIQPIPQEIMPDGKPLPSVAITLPPTLSLNNNIKKKWLLRKDMDSHWKLWLKQWKPPHHQLKKLNWYQLTSTWNNKFKVLTFLKKESKLFLKPMDYLLLKILKINEEWLII